MVICQLFNPEYLRFSKNGFTELFTQFTKISPRNLRHKNPREASFTQSYFKTERTAEQLKRGTDLDIYLLYSGFGGETDSR